MINKTLKHPTLHYAAWYVFKLNIHNHCCVCEWYCDNGIQEWSDTYYGSQLYDFVTDKYYIVNKYVGNAYDWEELMGSPCSISDDYNLKYDIEAIEFYKAWIESDEENAEEFYNNIK